MLRVSCRFVEDSVIMLLIFKVWTSVHLSLATDRAHPSDGQSFLVPEPVFNPFSCISYFLIRNPKLVKAGQIYTLFDPQLTKIHLVLIIYFGKYYNNFCVTFFKSKNLKMRWHVVVMPNSHFQNRKLLWKLTQKDSFL